MVASSRSYHIAHGFLWICMPTWLLVLAPWLVGAIVIALLVLLGVYLWRDARATQREQPSSAEGALLIGLLILSVIALLLFVVVALASMAGPCLSAPTSLPGAISLPARPSAGTIKPRIGTT